MASLLVTGCLVCLLGAEPDASAGAPSIDVRPLPGLLLLHTGQVLAGTISRTGDRYRVEVDHGEIRVRADQVQAFCRDLAEAYRFQRDHLRPADTRARVALVQWCLRQRLLDEAQTEIDALAASGLDARTLAAFRQQIQVLRMPRPVPEVLAPPRPFLPVSARELSATLDSIPTSAVEQFVTAVEPLLLNSCLAGGCHGPQADNRLHLHRTPSGRGHSRRLTQRNLHAVLQLVDRQQPDDSPLLCKLAAPHGQVRETPLDAAQLQLLARWVQSVAANDTRVPRTVTRVGAMDAAHTADDPSANPSSDGEVHTPTTQRAPRSPRQPDSAIAAPPRDPTNVDDPGSDPDDLAAPAADAATAPTDESPAEGETAYTPVDPFDPEIFNRGLAPH